MVVLGAVDFIGTDGDVSGLEAGEHEIETVIQNETVLGENMTDRVIPYAESTGKSYLPFSTESAEEWDSLSPAERYYLNDRALRIRINAGDAFEYIGRDPNRVGPRGFDLTGSELLRLSDRGIPFTTINLGR